jgi:FkbM family methyltransferase
MWKDANHKIVQAQFRSQIFSMAVYRNGDIVSAAIENKGNWESIETNLIIERLLTAKQNGRGMFVDIGANIGWFTFAIAAVASVPVIAFEPFPENLALINHTLCMNPNLQQNIQVLPFGLHSKDNIVCSFWQDRTINAGDTVTVCGDKGEDPAVVYSSGFRKLAEAPMQSLDSFLANGVLRVPPGKGGVVAKMDIEGFEPIAMRGASRFLHDPATRPKFLFAEVDPTLLTQAARANALPQSNSTVEHFLDQMKLDGYRADLHQSQKRAVFIALPQSNSTVEHSADELNALLRRMQLGLESEPNLCHNSYEMAGEFKIEPIVKICLDSTVKEGACNVVSLGIDYNFIFDDLMLSWGCEVRSFDPSMRPGEYDRGPRHKFYHVGIAGHSGTNVKNTLYTGERYSGVDSFRVKSLATIMQEQQFGHVIVRMDIEGAEWDTLQNWLEADVIDKVDQLFIEIHMYTPNEYLRYAQILLQLQTRMDLFWMTVNVQAPGRVGDCADCELKVWELGYKRH